MPEGGEDKKFLGDLKEHAGEECESVVLFPPSFLTLLPVQAVIFSRCFAEGTREKPYSSISVNKAEYDPILEPIPADFTPNEHDLKRAKTSFKYLVERPLTLGPLCFSF